MVKVREDRPLTADGTVDLTRWLDRITELAGLADDARPRLQAACERAYAAEQAYRDQPHPWAQGASSYLTGLEMVDILAELKVDADALVAAILYRAVREQKYPLSELRAEFGDTVASLVDGVLRMAAISTPRHDINDSMVLGQPSAEQTENIRKMLVAMVDDVRVALIKLAERTCAIRALKNAAEEKRQRVAREVADVYAPLAHRLGIGHIKWELEDLSFRYLEPDAYKQIAKLLDERRLDRENYIGDVIDLLQRSLAEAGIDAQIHGRAKHIFSIWRKMRRKGIGFSQVYDIRAVRVLVSTVRDCYSVLGIVHGLWRNIPNEFDDYIASPKENGYRSLHTAVIGPHRKVLEIQIRTHAMHEEAEFGVCAHWRYKGTDKEGKGSYDQKIAWLRQVLEWHEEVGGNPLDDHLRAGIEQDRIYVFTPEGHIVDLPAGATPLDFAYRIHTEVGHRCRGVKVNGRILPLNTPLRNSDQVEILTGKREAPSRDWLAPGLGYVTTQRARYQIQHWFRQQARDQNIADGRALLDREFKRLAMLDLDFEQLAGQLDFDSLEDLYAAVGASDIGVAQVFSAAQRLVQDHDEQLQMPLTTPAKAQLGKSELYIAGVGNLATRLSVCCNPVPGDAIVGYITPQREVAIHRQDCHRALQLQAEQPERIIKVEWGAHPEHVYPAEILIEAYDRFGLLKDITSLLDAERVNILAMQTLSDKSKHTVDMSLTVEIESLGKLARVLAKLNQLPNIASARRHH